MERAAKPDGDLTGSLERRNPSMQAGASGANILDEVHEMNTTVKVAVNQEKRADQVDHDMQVTKLENSVENMYEFSRSGFERIEAITKLALKAMENPSTYNHVDNLGMVFETIWGIAESARMCVETEAAHAGVTEPNMHEEAQTRRFMASVAAKQGVAA